MIEKHILEIKKLEEIERNFLHLCANENIVSKTVRRLICSRISERYFFGGGLNRVTSIGNAIFVGLNEIKNLEDYAKRLLEKRLKGCCANFNCLSGLHTMMSVLLAVTNPGDYVMSVREKDGGHFATHGIINITGRRQIYAVFNYKSFEFDIKKTALIFKKVRAKLLYLDISNQIKPIDLQRLRTAIGKKGIIVYDASHTLGLIIGGAFPNPLLSGVNILTANTHKTFPGPQKGLIVFRDKNYGNYINNKINSCLVSSVHTHHLIALCATVIEMIQFGRPYARQIIKNANALALELQKRGFLLRKADDRHYTYNHQIHVFIPKNITPIQSFKRLIKNNIALNIEKNILGDKSFMRIGVQEITRLGMKESDMCFIGEIINEALLNKNIRNKVDKIKKTFRRVEFSLD